MEGDSSAPLNTWSVVAKRTLAVDAQKLRKAPTGRAVRRGAESEGAWRVNGGGRCRVVGRPRCEKRRWLSKLHCWP